MYRYREGKVLSSNAVKRIMLLSLAATATAPRHPALHTRHLSRLAPRHALLSATAATHGVAPRVAVSSAFDSGNIRLVGVEGTAVRLRIVADPLTELEARYHMQWFAFRATLDARHADAVATYAIDNAGLCSYASAWEGAEVCVSYDRREWRRVAATRYDAADGTLRWEWRHNASHPSVYFAYFDMYPFERHLDLVARCTAARGVPGLRVASLGQSLDGREIDLITVGRGPLQAWVIHRQHPGEPQASFFAEGLLHRLLGLEASSEVDGLAARMLEAFTWHVVPLMNPDGASRGYLRTNAAGANLNREWAPTGSYAAPTLERSPEVLHVISAMDATGVDLFVDVHGDEGLPFAFAAGNEGASNWGPRLKALHGAFVGALSRANADMQAAFGYTPDAPLMANPAVSADQVGQRFDCLALTLEMPFKDNAANPEGRRGDCGFDGPRCARLGAALLDAAAYVEASLRGVPEPHFPRADDAYVRPTEDPAEVAEFLAGRARGVEGGGADLWKNPDKRTQWYERGKAYWEWAAPTNNGVMSGIGALHNTDVADSRRFLTEGPAPLWPSPAFRANARALDLGAGIGRVSGALLLDLCGVVDLVDGSAVQLEQARAALSVEPPPSQARGVVGELICCELQSFVPSRTYDLIWIQWTTMYLTDDDLCRLLRDCQRALAPGGFIVLKDNVIDEVKGPKGLLEGRYMVDEEDASVSRAREHLLHLVEEAGLSVVAATTADLESEELHKCLSQNQWEELHPVAILALR